MAKLTNTVLAVAGASALPLLVHLALRALAARKQKKEEETAAAADAAAPRRLRVLHLFGSSTSAYYEKLSVAYACEAIDALAGPTSARFEFVFAHVHPRGDDGAAEPTWSFPAAADAASLAAAPRVSRAAGVARLAALAPDACVPHMFCYDGMTSYRALFELLDVPLVGCDSASMALSTNKSRAKAVMAAAGTPVPAGELLRAGERPSMPCPIIVKPCSEDNSMGVSLCRTDADVDAALAGALAFDDEVLVEEFVPLGRELRVGVIAEPRAPADAAGGGGDDDGDDDAPSRLRVLPTLEYHLPADKPIRASNDKLTSDAKGVMSGFAKTNRSCPADVDEALWAKVEAGAKRAHVALGCRDYSLYDVRVSPSGEVAFLEACLYCSFAPRSVVVLMAGATAEPALAHVRLFTELVERAARRKQQPPAPGGDGEAQALGMKSKPAAKARAVTFTQPVTVAA